MAFSSIKDELYFTKIFEVETGEIFSTTKFPLLFSSLFPLLAGDKGKKLGPAELVRIPAETLFWGVFRGALTTDSQILFHSKLVTKTEVNLGQKSKLSSLKNAVERFGYIPVAFS